jgi:hypothetical protein
MVAEYSNLRVFLDKTEESNGREYGKTSIKSMRISDSNSEPIREMYPLQSSMTIDPLLHYSGRWNINDDFDWWTPGNGNRQ